MRFFSKILLTFSIILLTSCYEGWEYDQNSGGPGDPTNPDSALKPILYTLFTPIYASAGAIDNFNCGIDSAFKEYRINEWSERVDKLAKELKAISQTFVMHAIVIPDGGCDDLSEINLAAIDTQPWAPDAAPDNSDPTRKTIHVKAIYWDSDVALSPSNLITADENWAAWDSLIDGGVNAASYDYFTVSNSSLGFFGSWMLSNFQYDYAAAGIYNPDPSQSGLKERESQIKSDVDDFINYIRGTL